MKGATEFSQPSSQALKGDDGRSDLLRTCVVTRQLVTRQFEPSREMQTFEPAHAQRAIVEAPPLRGELQIRRAVLLSFCDPFPQECLELQALSGRQWRHLLQWLYLSGLALYFFDRLVELQRCKLLPANVFARLQQSLNENSQRTHGMIAESIAIQQEFQRARLRYAVLKGLSLCPSSVPRPELRSQFDLDFLVAEEDIPEARRILVGRGYRLYGSNETYWEYKLNERPGLTLKDLYRYTGYWVVELHTRNGATSRGSLLERLDWREFNSFRMPVLSPVDVFLQQGLHAYKHICSQFTRAAFLVEFRRHVLFRFSDNAFWDELLSTVKENSHARIALGVTTLLISQVMGDFAPEALVSGTVRCVPPSAQLWVEFYGARAALRNFPGTKLYLLLRMEPQAVPAPRERSLRQFLIPLRLPPPVIQALPNEAFFVRLGRYRMQAAYIFSRFRFHLVEGLRFAWESHRWRRLLNEVAR